MQGTGPWGGWSLRGLRLGPGGVPSGSDRRGEGGGGNGGLCGGEPGWRRKLCLAAVDRASLCRNGGGGGRGRGGFGVGAKMAVQHGTSHYLWY
jgi:hypothetical protein